MFELCFQCSYYSFKCLFEIRPAAKYLKIVHFNTPVVLFIEKETENRKMKKRFLAPTNSFSSKISIILSRDF